MFGISPSARIRPSPYYASTIADGVRSFTTYNHMLMPTGYGDPEGEYWRLINGVAQWDVAVERQVQLEGPDAAKLAQVLCPRDLSACQVGHGKYVPLCNHQGVLINDPILLRLDENRFWLSIADSNIWFWASAIAAERGLRVTVSEPDVSPMALQGPRAADVVASVCGDWVRALKHFWFKPTTIDGIPVVVARSGWSKQGGFEIYLMDGSRADTLWNIFREAGKRWDIGPGNPNSCERIESGLFNYGADIDTVTNPFEVRLGKYVDLDAPDDVVGIQTLRRLHGAGIRRQTLGVLLDGEQPMEPDYRWLSISGGGDTVGHLTTSVWSYRLRRNIGIALVRADCAAQQPITVHRDGATLAGTLTALPFI